MAKQSNRFFSMLDPALPDEEREKLVSEEIERFQGGLTDDELTLCDEDETALRTYTLDPSPKVRAMAVGLLCEGGLATWEQLEKWALDPAEEVRQKVLWAMESIWWSPTGKMCRCDKPRCIGIMACTARRYDDYQAGISLQELSEEGKEWLRLTWRAADMLLDDTSAELITMLTCTYFDHVIPDNNWGPGDPHIEPWIQGPDANRKMILLRVATYRGLEEGRPREIVEALAQDKDRSIGRSAQGVLSGEITYRDLSPDD